MTPLSKVLWVFAPPEGMSDAEARRLGVKSMLAGLVVLVLGVGLLVYLAQNPAAGAQAMTGAAVPPPEAQADAARWVLFAVIFPAGLGYSLVVGGLFRALCGMPSKSGGVRVLRAFFGFALFVVTFVGSLIVYGQVSG